MRVVSLLPSATELCYRLGVAPVGVSSACDHPPATRDQPVVSRSRIDPEGASADVNDAVAHAEDGAGVYAVDRERLAALDPDLILTQGVCEVCAVDEVVVADAVADLGLDARVLTLDVHGLADLYDATERIGAALGREGAAADLVSELRERVDAVREHAPAAGDRPSVAVLDWMDPVMVAGHWVPELVAVAGGTYPMEAAGAHSRPREWSEVRAVDPDVVVVSPCGFDLEQIRGNLADLTDRPGWSELRAVESGRVHLLDGHHYVNRPGPRLADTCEYLAALLWPEAFPAPPADVARPLAGPPA